MKHPLIYCNDMSGNPLKAAPCIARRKMLLLILSFVALLRSGGEKECVGAPLTVMKAGSRGPHRL